ncbi:hypothetical protein CTZ27_25300 [Streptomyces griseocarneus]|nr:hypothetical protein CTZ27_25300 [Streptomyces griseocarneus]
MRHRFILPRCVVGGLAACTTVAGLLAAPALAAPPSRAAADAVTASRHAAPPVPPTGPTAAPNDRDAVQHRRLTADRLPPIDAERPTPAPKPGVTKEPAAPCNPSDFGSRSGSALVSLVTSSDKECVNRLFGVTGTDARAVFREAQMVTVADAFKSTAASYPGDNTTGAWQLALFLRAGYYVQYQPPHPPPRASDQRKCWSEAPFRRSEEVGETPLGTGPNGTARLRT